MARRQMHQLDTSVAEERIAGNKQGVGLLGHKSGQGRIDLAAGAGVEDLSLQADGASGRQHVFQSGFGTRRVGWIDEHGNPNRCGHQLTQQI